MMTICAMVSQGEIGPMQVSCVWLASRVMVCGCWVSVGVVVCAVVRVTLVVVSMSKMMMVMIFFFIMMVSPLVCICYVI